MRSEETHPSPTRAELDRIQEDMIRRGAAKTALQTRLAGRRFVLVIATTILIGLALWQWYGI